MRKTFVVLLIFAIMFLLSNHVSAVGFYRVDHENPGWNNDIHPYSDGSYVYFGQDKNIHGCTFDGSTLTVIDTVNLGGSSIISGVHGNGSIVAVVHDDVSVLYFNGTGFSLNASLDIGGGLTGVWVDGSYIYVSTWSNGLRVLYFNGTGLSLIDSIDNGGVYRAVFGNDSFIFTPTQSSVMRAYSFNGSALSLEGSVVGSFSEGWCNDTHMFVSEYSKKLSVLTFHGSFNSLDSYTLPGTVYGVWGDDSYVYAGCAASGVYVFSLNGTSLFKDDDVDTGLGLQFEYVYGDGSYVYVSTDGTNGVYMYSWINPPSNVAISREYNSLNFSWVPSVDADTTLVVVNTSGNPSNVTNGTLLYNGTDSFFDWENRSANTTYYAGFFTYNSSVNGYSSPVYANITTLADVVAPTVDVTISVGSGFNVDTATINVSVDDDYGGFVVVNVTANGEYYNESVGVPGYISEFTFNLSDDGVNIVFVNASDAAGNTVSYSESMTFYYVNCSLYNERDGTVYDWSNAKTFGNLTGCLLTVPDKNLSIDLYKGENTSFTYVSSTEDIIRINLSFGNTGEDVIRSFDVSLLDPVSRIGLIEVEESFYAQFIYAATKKPVCVKNVLSDCFVHARYTYDAYEDYYSCQVVTINMLYYLYTYSSGNKVLLASIEGSRASTINLDFLSYENLSYEFSMLSDGLAVSKTTNTTLKMYYANLEADNSKVEIRIYDGANLIFQHVEYDDPNEFTLYFDYSTFTISEEMLKLQLLLTKDGGSVETVEKFISIDGKVGLIESGVAVILALMFSVFGLTLASSKRTFGVIGIIVHIISLGITVLAVPVWYVIFVQVIIVVLLVITIFIFKKENAQIT